MALLVDEEPDVYLPASPRSYPTLGTPSTTPGEAERGSVPRIGSGAVASRLAPPSPKAAPARPRGACRLATLLCGVAGGAIGVWSWHQADKQGTGEWNAWRRAEIADELMSRVSKLTAQDARKLANAIDKHDDYDRPGSLRVRLVGFPTYRKLELLSVRGAQVSARTMSIRHARLPGLEEALRDAVDAQKVEEFPVRRETLAASRRFFRFFPSVGGRRRNFLDVRKELQALNSTERAELRASLLEDFRRSFHGLNGFLSRRSRDVRAVLLSGWMPPDLEEAFLVFDLLCQPVWWMALRKTGALPAASASRGRRRAAAWLLHDPKLSRLPIWGLELPKSSIKGPIVVEFVRARFRKH